MFSLVTCKLFPPVYERIEKNLLKVIPMVQIWFVMSNISNRGMAGFWIKVKTMNSVMVYKRDYLCVDPLSI